MTRKTPLALCAAQPIGDDAGVPEWIHLLPAGEARTVDGRGPYRIGSLQSLASASLGPGQKLVLDECHSTDKAAVLGLPAPARGWIVELQARDDGLWGRVEWTDEGRQLMEGKAYAGISPVITHSQDKQVLRVLRASLTNTPNLMGLTALHSEEEEDDSMDWKAKLIELLGLDGTADDAAIEAALKAKMERPALQSEEILQLPAVVALQSQVAELTTRLNASTEATARKAAEDYVDGQIAAGRVGLKPVRDEYVALHMADADQAVKLIGAMPVLKGAAITGDAPPAPGQDGLTAEDRQVMALFNVSEDDYRASQAALGQKKEAL